ncbi:tRNA threonylcarbamoyl adenosine modification protein, Sua5/YciO/YrdC/YwlC family [Ehrlichia chaffeensis str. Heartland]|uniref:L-threonylcarbamoyladenylate synthase n=1 Tax=Ehrlichia chaffeensis (strain ATCC CRL-10679 / Arkansas) TaxID=205920 RepID=Q2GG33_EHRCR|nr:L-threonylcarbamoyladenylate synthase [Ehrlichia chaffeensis]ABD45140.1 Sua5/YciO/YrdC/YwlC family protein [Ehrlichia chaffeensis str. Arkansas]AHX03859.1 tRNA threonylcarbamoyl adenosine modification protein, Sua5/YciO/YrdC/YwlC family [Ehrlichia chaffeensis str. Heartland]AHX05415.1 tRNA threonylcarbamoyl adenosine modification protein, Sua5/YciO/YrdC/YwlC family [Ehrlichia chaffeensis str. Jax]AHX06403.1 tRNA threonylcarbamoyl adenosine modification protein, Sua5/YciO/YrdC/YwlC family [Eh
MISEAVQALKNKHLILFPTETVYALAGSAYSIEAVQKIYQIKGRSYNKPLSLLLSNIDKIKQFSTLTEHTFKIIQKLSPGPVTFVLPIHNYNKLPRQFFNDTIGIRIPDHPIALEILSNFDNPVVGTSVNISGQPSVTASHQVQETIKQHISVIIEDDSLVNGIESTVIDLTSYKILRTGAVSEKKIQDIIHSI